MAKVNFIKTKTMDKKTAREGFTQDSFSNFINKLGYGTDNQLSNSTYSLNNLLSRNRTELEAAYRSSWLVGQSVDVIAEDMTKSGINMLSELEPDDIKKLHVSMNDFNVWEALCDTIKWARLYGGAIGVIMIDGAKYDQPLNLEAIGKKTFKGVLVLDRWMCEPSLEDIIDEMCKDFGKPRFYKIHASVASGKLPAIKVHYSRVLRFDGIKLPYYQKLYENYWGLSVVERMYDRLVSYDSATLGASQLLYKAYLRVVQIEGLRQALAAGGAVEAAVIKQFKYIRQMQNIEGITMLDSKDQFAVHNYTFSGIPDLLIQLGQQISGATGIPLVRLFGQSPSGFNSGDMDLRNYYDNINRQQENTLRTPLSLLLEIISRSELGKPLPEDFEYTFNSLWQMSEKEKSEIAASDSAIVNQNYGGGLYNKKQSLKELLDLSRTTGRGTNITQEDIDNAKEDDFNIPPSGIIEEENFNIPPSGIIEEENLSNSENENIDLTTKSPELAKEQGIKTPIIGKEQSINEKEQETQVDEEVEKSIPGFKQVSEAIQPGLARMRENWQKALQNIKSKFFTSDDDEGDHWVTVSKEGGNPRRILLNAKGEIIGGDIPKEQQGKKIDEAAKQQSKESASVIKKEEKKNFSEAKRNEEGKLVSVNGEKLPDHISKLKIPPAWKNVVYSEDENSKVWVVGEDSKGRKQVIYSDKFKSEQAQAKFKRIEELNNKFNKILDENEKAISKGKEEAIITKLIMQTGIRPGSETDTGAKVKAYGATTLEGKHVVINDDGTVNLNFIGKKGVQNNIRVEDKELIKYLKERAKNQDEKIFKANNQSLLNHVHTLDGGSFKTKDFRTLLGTKTAMAIVEKEEPPKTEKEYKKKVIAVAKQVAQKLGNTATVCLQAYINPSVFSQWQIF